MSEPGSGRSRDTRLERRRLYHELLAINPHVQELRQRRDSVTAQFERNRQTLRDDPTAEVESYNLETLIPDLRRYPVKLSHGGELYTTDFPNNSHLPRRAEVPSALRLTPGDLHAAAQWGIMLQLELSGKRAPQQVQAARALLNFVEYQTALRRLFFEKHVYDDQIWDRIGHQNDRSLGSQTMVNLADGFSIQPVTQEQITAYTERPPVLAERMCFTLLARLGGRSLPPLTVFQPRAGVDRFKKVDILARVEQSQTEPWLIGIDVTLTNKPKEIWDKYNRTRDAEQVPKRVVTTDPGSGAPLVLQRDIVVWPLQVLPEEVLRQWEAQRGTTTITPEYMIPPRYRALLSRSLLKRISSPEDNRVYDDEAIAKTYGEMYGAYDS